MTWTSKPTATHTATTQTATTQTATTQTATTQTATTQTPTKTSESAPIGRFLTRPGAFVVALATILAVAALPALAAELVVSNTLDSGTGSLRAALLAANSSGGADRVVFNLAGAGPFVIQPQTPLPVLTDPVNVDGTSQPGWAGLPLVVLDGSALAAGGNGLEFGAGSGGSAVRGLAIHGFTESAPDVGGHAVVLGGAGSHVVEDSHLGIDAAGVAAAGNEGCGVLIDGSVGNQVGHGNGRPANVISGNDLSGVEIRNPLADGAANVVLGNFIGTNRAGSSVLGNGEYGVWVKEGDAGTIGGTTTAEGNLISGNQSSGVFVDRSSGVGVLGNFIGTDVTGSTDLGNGVDGVRIFQSFTNEVGRTTAVPGTPPGNLISGNEEDGVHILGDTVENTVEGNLIGTDAGGTEALGNGVHGVLLEGGFINRVGDAGGAEGMAPTGAANVISANGAAVLEAGSGVALDFGPFGTFGNVVAGNFIGTQIDGVSALGNAEHGVSIFGGASDNVVGTLNVIAWNAADGVRIDGLRNRVDSNLIWQNGSQGVHVAAGGGNELVSNELRDNAALGIDLGTNAEGDGDGVTPNDAGDGDGGANALLNFPVILGVTGTSVVGKMKASATSLALTLEAFSSVDCDPALHGEGELPLGTVSVVTDGNGDADFEVVYESGIPAGHEYLTATATDDGGNTSEFSLCFPLGIFSDGFESGDTSSWSATVP